MDDLQTILEQSRKAYDDHLGQQLAWAMAEENRRNELQAKGRAEVREWLCTFLPEPLVDYIDLTNYSPYDAGQWHSDNGDRKGVWLTISLPDAFPIAFNVYDSDGLRLVKEPYESPDKFFAVPTSASVKRDEEGTPYIYYHRYRDRAYGDWQTAVGSALARWQINGEELLAALNRPTEPVPASDSPATESEPSWLLQAEDAAHKGLYDETVPLMALLAIGHELKRIADALYDYDGDGIGAGVTRLSR